MTAAQNLRALLEGGRPDGLPWSLNVGTFGGFTEPVLRRFRAETGAEDPDEHFDCAWRVCSLTARFGGADPTALHEAVRPGTTFDEWGIGHWAGGAEETPDRMLAPLTEAVADVEALPSPVVEPLAEPERIADFHRRGYPVFGYAGSVYEWSWWLRGMDRFLMDLVLEPAVAEAVVRKVAGHTRRLALASAAAGIDVLCFYDDAGMQTGLQVSPALWRRFIKPAWAGILDAVRREHPGAKTFLHSCGDVRAILPDMVELGFDILHPLQPECMDFAEVHRELGRDIVLCATISSQRTLPFGTPDDVRAEVRRLKALCGDARRGILCPSNRIQPETPWANILAFIEEARA